MSTNSLFQSGRRNMDLDLAFSQKKRGRWSAEACRDAALLSLLVFSPLSLLSLCLSLLVGTVYLLLLGKLSPKHKRSCKQVDRGMLISCWFIHE